MRFQQFKSRCLKILFWLLLVTYPSISRKILMLFKCVEIGRESYMMWDTRILCFTYSWWSHAVYACVFAVVYIIGVPALFFHLLREMRNAHTYENTNEIESDQQMKLKFLRLVKMDVESRGKYWSRMKTMKDEKRRIQDYLRRLNLRDAKNLSRLGFLYRFFKEEYYWFEMFEFIFKLFMTGVMVHIAPGTVSQLLVGMVITFIGFGFHIAAKPYREMSNNILMISAKFQLFLCLISALLLKMEVSFFQNDSSMQEMDIKFLSKLIIYSSVTLLVLWIITIFYDIWIARSKRLEEAIVINRERRSRLKFKNFHKKMRLFNSLKAKEDDDNAKEVGLLKEIRVKFGANSKEYQSIMKIMRQEAAETVEDKLRDQEEELGAYISPDKP